MSSYPNIQYAPTYQYSNYQYGNNNDNCGNPLLPQPQCQAFLNPGHYGTLPNTVTSARDMLMALSYMLQQFAMMLGPMQEALESGTAPGGRHGHHACPPTESSRSHGPSGLPPEFSPSGEIMQLLQLLSGLFQGGDPFGFSGDNDNKTRPNNGKPKAPTEEQALNTLFGNFDKINGGKTFTKADLERVAKDDSNPKLQAAAKKVLADPALLDKLDADANGTKDGKIGKEGLLKALSDKPLTNADKTSLAALEGAGGSLWAKGSLSMDDLKRIAKDGIGMDGKPVSAELKKAVQHVVDNPSLFTVMDSMDDPQGGKADGRINRGDTDHLLKGQKPRVPEPTVEKALSTLFSNFDKLNGGNTFTKADLERVAKDGTNPELQAAAKKVLADPALLDKLDADANGTKDGKIGKEGLLKSMSSRPLVPADTTALAALEGAGGSLWAKGSVNMKDLENIAKTGIGMDGKPVSAEVKKAAQHIVDNPHLFSVMDSIDDPQGGKADGTINRGNVDHFLKGQKPAVPEPTQEQALNTLFDNFDKINGGKTFSKADLERIAKDGTNPELQAAAKKVLADPALLDKLDADANGTKDGQIGKEGLLKALNDKPLTDADKTSLAALEGAGGSLWAKGSLSMDDLKRIAKDGIGMDGKPVSAELKKAVQHVVDNPQLFTRMDSMDDPQGGKTDGRINRGDTDHLLKGQKPAVPEPTPEQMSTILWNNFDKLSKGRGFFNKADLEAAAKDGTNPELQAAAKKLLGDQALMDKIDGNISGGAKDGQIGRINLSTELLGAGYTAQDKAAFTTLTNAGGSLWAKGSVTVGDLERIAKDGIGMDGKPVSAELKGAIQYMLDNPGLAPLLDSANDRDKAGDGKLWKGDFDQALK